MSAIKVPKDRKPLLKSQLYKQEVDSPEDRPKVKRWEKVYCALYPSMLVYYRKRDSKKPLDVISLNNDFLVRKVKANDKSKGKSKGTPKELFFVTDLDHINVYFGTANADKKRRWVEKFKSVIEQHQKKAEEQEHVNRRRTSFRNMIDQAHSRGSRLAIDGTRLSKRELKELDRLNDEHEQDLQDVELMRDSWKQEALVAKERLEEQKKRRKREKKRLKKAEKRLHLLLEEMNIRGHEREYQALEAEKQRKKLKKMKRRLSKTDLELRDYKNPYMDLIEASVSGAGTRSRSSESVSSASSYEITEYPPRDRLYYSSDSGSDSEESQSESGSGESASINMAEYPLYDSFDREEETLYEFYRRKYSSEGTRAQGDEDLGYDTEELMYSSSED